VTTTAPARGAGGLVRSRRDVVLAVVGAAVLVLAALPVHTHDISAAESAVFHGINGPAVLPFAVIWPVMQLGNFLAVPVAAVVAAVFRRWRLAVGLLIAGGAVYLLAKVVKRIVVRGRPDSLLDDVVIRGQRAGGLGFVSGHAAVVTALLVVAWPWLGRPARIVGVVLAVAVCLARVHVGAHLPLDVVGGAALGLAVGGVVRLVLGHPR
jgi:membrane-associated phospholipid phosphatase